MANSNPWQGRLAKKRRRKPGTLADLQRRLWGAIVTAEKIVDAAETPDLAIRGLHCISQLSGQYLKALEVGEYEARIAAMEQTITLEWRSA